MKNFLIGLGVVVLGIGIFVSGYLFGRTIEPLGLSVAEISYPTATNASSTCVSATSTVVLSTSTQRTSAIIALIGSTSTFLCRATICATNTGINLTSNFPVYEQKDGYTGPYSCVAGSTSTLTTSYSP